MLCKYYSKIPNLNIEESHYNSSWERAPQSFHIPQTRNESTPMSMNFSFFLICNCMTSNLTSFSMYSRLIFSETRRLNLLGKYLNIV